jgi:GNAT superfamily N-acetyltransferase
MKLSLVRFTWDLTRFATEDAALPPHYRIESAPRERARELRAVISSSFRLDPAWNPALREVMQILESWLNSAFAPETTNVCLALRHGARIIGVSVLSLEPLVESNLAPGPCILTEYRNRGFGSRLLEHSFQALYDAGLTRAFATTRAHTPAAKFLYPKFNGIAEPIDWTPPLLAA